MRFSSQRISLQYFSVALVLFLLQVVTGLLASAKFLWTPDPLLHVLSFNQARAMHINLLVFWLLLTFMGATYFVAADDADREIHSPFLAKLQLWILTLAGVGSVGSYLIGYSWGMPFLEQPTVMKYGIVVGALIFLYNVGRTLFNGCRPTGISGILLSGMVMLAVLFLFGIPFMPNLSKQYYFWFWVIHLWTEGAWELIASALMAWLLLRLTGVERMVVTKWVYVEVALVLITGIIGTGHHYYWIGTPEYWLLWGAVFGALEPIPILLMLVDVYRHMRARRLAVTNPMAMYWAAASGFVHFMGAGVWGLGQTLPQINRYTHGTQITASHGHFAFWGAYGMLAIALIYFIVPRIRGTEAEANKLGVVSFLTLNLSMILMVMALLIAGIVQAYLQRVLGMDFMVVQGYMRLWFAVRFVMGCIFLVGTLLFLMDMVRLTWAPVRVSPPLPAPQPV